VNLHRRPHNLASLDANSLDTHTNHQHTYVETESVRYAYQAMEQLYLLLITNKSSNIMEDLETLRLLANLVYKVYQVAIQDSTRVARRCT